MGGPDLGQFVHMLRQGQAVRRQTEEQLGIVLLEQPQGVVGLGPVGHGVAGTGDAGHGDARFAFRTAPLGRAWGGVSTALDTPGRDSLTQSCLRSQ